MIPITKRIRSKIMLWELDKIKTGKILDVGGADSYFAKKAKKKGYDIESIDILDGQDFLLMKKTDANSITALALMWHINNKQFFEKCKELNSIKNIFILQGKNWTEPIAHLYSPDHHHEVNQQDISILANFNGFKKEYYKNFLLWDFYFFKRKEGENE